jgi:hypothetical protein
MQKGEAFFNRRSYFPGAARREIHFAEPVGRDCADRIICPKIHGEAYQHEAGNPRYNHSKCVPAHDDFSFRTEAILAK